MLKHFLSLSWMKSVVVIVITAVIALWSNEPLSILLSCVVILSGLALYVSDSLTSFLLEKVAQSLIEAFDTPQERRIFLNQRGIENKSLINYLERLENDQSN